MTTKSELATLQTAWRTAASRPDGLVIACPDIATARNLRFRLYNAVKPFRDGKAQPDSALAEALAVLKVGITMEPPSVNLTRKCVVDLVSAALEGLGVSPDEALTAEDAAIAESLAHVQALTKAADAREADRAERVDELFRPTAGANPFYKRGDNPGESSEG